MLTLRCSDSLLKGQVAQKSENYVPTKTDNDKSTGEWSEDKALQVVNDHSS